MNIMRELPTNIPFEDIMTIYNKGNKMATALTRYDVVGYSDCLIRVNEGSYR